MWNNNVMYDFFNKLLLKSVDFTWFDFNTYLLNKLECKRTNKYLPYWWITKIEWKSHGYLMVKIVGTLYIFFGDVVFS